MTKQFIVEYTVDYVHRVMVGVKADSSNEAIAKATKAFDEATLWDNSEEMPLLFDDFEETDYDTLKFSATEAEELPETDMSVQVELRKYYSAQAALSLLNGDVDSSLIYAKKAYPEFTPINTKTCTQ